jgi:hypothetical protein
MKPSRNNAPPPDLRIVPIENVHPHEENDSQRSIPLTARIRESQHIINPPIVAPMGGADYVILDGANRCHALRSLNFPHILIQVVAYDSGYVELETWQHVVSDWQSAQFLDKLQQLDAVKISEGPDNSAIAHILFRDGPLLALCATVDTTYERNSVLRDVVRIYQANANLYRTAINEPEEIWSLYPQSITLVTFPRCEPADIIAAARYRAYLPPGVSRHIIHGRALKLNYPIDRLRDTHISLDAKNEALGEWIRGKLARRQLRYYVESTYQFDE